VAREVNDVCVGELRSHILHSRCRMCENRVLREAGDRALNFPFGVGQVLGGVVDGKDGGWCGAVCDRRCGGEGFGVGGIGEVDVVEGVAASGGGAGVFCPGSVER